MSDKVLVKVEQVSKKYCRSLKQSLWYGVQDVAGEFTGRKGPRHELRKNEFWAVQDVSFELRRGECLGLIGPNGAGKSTVLKLLNGLIKPDVGQITMRGRVGALIELGAGFNPILTARENIYVNGSVLGFSRNEIDRKFDEIIDFAEIHQFVDTPVQNFSSGMAVRLGFSIAAQMEPDVLLIDEVLAVGDMGFVAKCFNRIGELMRSCAVIFVSHSMPNVSRLCTQVITLDEGRTIYQGSNSAKGIEKMFSLFEMSKRVVTFESGQASLSDIWIEADGVEDVREVNSGSDLKTHICCDIDPAVTQFCANVLIFDQNQNALVYSSSIQSGKRFSNIARPNHLVVDLGAIHLNPGVYSVDVSITDAQNVHVFAQVQSARGFKVNAPFVGYAPIQIPGAWKHVDE